MAKIRGTSGDDMLVGTTGADVIAGLEGDDTLTGGLGADTFRFSAANFGHDEITDFSSQDRIDLREIGVASFADLQAWLVFGKPFWQPTASADTDLFVISAGKTSRITLDNVDEDDLSSSNFIFETSDKSLRIEGTNKINQYGYSDYLFGANGSDRISGLGGADMIFAGGGKDKIDGGKGEDSLFGGAGADTFIFASKDGQQNFVLDFRSNDKIDLSAYNYKNYKALKDDITFIEGPDDSQDQVLITPNDRKGSEAIILLGVSRNELAENDFIL